MSDGARAGDAPAEVDIRTPLHNVVHDAMAGWGVINAIGYAKSYDLALAIVDAVVADPAAYLSILVEQQVVKRVGTGSTDYDGWPQVSSTTPMEYGPFRGNSLAGWDPKRLPWKAMPNDLIGGWCVMAEDKPPSSAETPEIADFCAEDMARHIALLHNHWLMQQGDYVDTSSPYYMGAGESTASSDLGPLPTSTSEPVIGET